MKKLLLLLIIPFLTSCSLFNSSSKSNQEDNKLVEDYLIWVKAQDENTVKSYTDYLEISPSGKYVQEAIQKLIQLEIEKDKSEDVILGDLPDLEQIKQNDIDLNEHLFTIINITSDVGLRVSEILTVTYYGNTEKGFDSGTYMVGIDDCFEKSFFPGKYDFVVEVKDDASVRKYRTKKPYNFEGGFRTTDLELYISHEEVELEAEENIALDKKYVKCHSEYYLKMVYFGGDEDEFNECLYRQFKRKYARNGWTERTISIAWDLDDEFWEHGEGYEWRKKCSN